MYVNMQVEPVALSITDPVETESIKHKFRSKYEKKKYSTLDGVLRLLIGESIWPWKYNKPVQTHQKPVLAYYHVPMFNQCFGGQVTLIQK